MTPKISTKIQILNDPSVPGGIGVGGGGAVSFLNGGRKMDLSFK